MDFDAFAQQFRQRTAARMLEFEKALAKAQDELEKSAENAARSAQPRMPHGAHSELGVAGIENRRYPASPVQPRATGQVKSVLRRG